jgi:preprotein translocase subunit SecG
LPLVTKKKDIPVNFLIGILNVLIILSSLFLICIILIQRGKGGGLAGAFGGVGGSSAFGTKAGDIFTKITIGVVAGWMLTAMLLVVLTNSQASSASSVWGDDAISPSKDVSTSRSKTKPRSTGADKGLGDLPIPPPSPATDVGAGASPIPAPVDIQAIPDQPAKGAAPTPASPSSAPKAAAAPLPSTSKAPAATIPPPSSAVPAKTAPAPKGQ